MVSFSVHLWKAFSQGGTQQFIQFHWNSKEGRFFTISMELYQKKLLFIWFMKISFKRNCTYSRGKIDIFWYSFDILWYRYIFDNCRYIFDNGNMFNNGYIFIDMRIDPSEIPISWRQSKFGILSSRQILPHRKGNDLTNEK